jgi:anti-sigma regulatory factor (Ser/Thr protein kinase)
VKIEAIRDSLKASVLAREDLLGAEVEDIYASDLMSDVLAFGLPNSLLLTGLASQQSLISAHMAEFKAVVLLRGKRAKDGAERFATEHSMVLMSTRLDMYDACVRIHALRDGNGVQPKELGTTQAVDNILLQQKFQIEGNDFSKAGYVSTEVKSMLKKIGVDPVLIRSVAISCYEAEMNVFMHALRAKVDLTVTPRLIEVMLTDEGKGIPDVEQAMQEGFTTATDDQRALGFGSGLGLPNIKRNTDELQVTSEVGKGTTLVMRFFLQRPGS